MYRATLNANLALIMTGTSSQTTKRENYHHVIPSFRERASHTSWCYDVLHKTTQCNDKTNDCSAAHTRQLNKMPPCKPSIQRKRLASVKANGVYHKTKLCKYRNDPRWHLFSIKKTPCQPNSCANVLPEILVVWSVFITEPHRATRSCS